MGTVFKIAPQGTLTTLHSFDGSDGWSPYAGVVQATNGLLYGTTSSGGTGCGERGCGTVFRIRPSGASFASIYSFCAEGCADGANPRGTLVQASDGNLYGTTLEGGLGYGTIFRITPGGALHTLWTFSCNDDGGYPYAGLIQGTDENLYGAVADISPCFN